MQMSKNVVIEINNIILKEKKKLEKAISCGNYIINILIAARWIRHHEIRS